MHCVGSGGPGNHKPLSTKLINMGQIWEGREVGEFAPSSLCFLALLLVGGRLG